MHAFLALHGVARVGGTQRCWQILCCKIIEVPTISRPTPFSSESLPLDLLEIIPFKKGRALPARTLPIFAPGRDPHAPRPVQLSMHVFLALPGLCLGWRDQVLQRRWQILCRKNIEVPTISRPMLRTSSTRSFGKPFLSSRVVLRHHPTLVGHQYDKSRISATNVVVIEPSMSAMLRFVDDRDGAPSTTQFIAHTRYFISPALGSKRPRRSEQRTRTGNEFLLLSSLLRWGHRDKGL